MREEIADAVLDKVKHYTIGFGRAGDKPAAKGSGVLIKHGEMHGILTCTHVDEYLRDKARVRQPVGLVRLNLGQAQQAGVLDMGNVFTHVAGQQPWTPTGEDIAFIHLPADLAGQIARDCIFLDIEKNFTKPEPKPEDWSSLIRGHSVFGLVEEFTGETTRQSGIATTILKGVLTSGELLNIDAQTATLECFRVNLLDLPSSFGGTSGGGLWRVYVQRRADGKFEAVHTRLIGIASYEDNGSPPRIFCQGPGRIEALLKAVRGM
jgi:hypothetical protein